MVGGGRGAMTVAEKEVYVWQFRFLGVIVLAVTAQLHYGIGITYSVISACLLAWYAFNTRNMIPVKALALLIWTVAFAMIERQWFHFVDSVDPMKYDSVLFSIDKKFLFDGTLLQRFSGAAATDTYESLGLVLVFWFGWLLVENGPALKFLVALMLAYAVGSLFYLIVPACGPIYNGYDAGLSLVLLHGYPNCFPSLHVTTALLFIAFRPKGGTVAAVLFVAATALTTLVTGQHYVLDVVFAVPFTGCIAAAINKRYITAASLLSVVLVGAIAIHFA